MGKTLQKLNVEKNGWEKRILLLLTLSLFAFLTGFQALAQASLPASHEGPWQAMSKTGWSQSGLTSDYGGNLGGSTGGGSAQFDSADDQVTIHFGSAASTLTYYLNPRQFGTFGGTFVVEESVDGTAYTPLQTFGSGGTAISPRSGGTLVSNTPNAASRYIRFRYDNLNSLTHIMSLDMVTVQSLSGPEINLRAGATTQVSGSTYNFGNQNLNTTSSPLTFTVENTGIADLNLTGTPIVALSGTDASLFTVDQTTTASPVAAGSTTTFTVTFTAASAGTKTAALTIANDDADEASYVINLTGTGKDMAPVITALSPSSGIVGNEVVITGTDLFNVSSVTFNGTAATAFTVVSNTEIRATVPAGATTGPIAVTAPGGTGSSSTFTVYQVPTISAISPPAGAIGSEVTITGTNFTSDASIAFNGTAATSKTFVSATEFRAIVPVGATTGPITVTNPAGTATSATFTVYPTPTISAISPTAGPIGAEVTITGTGFTADASIAFNGTAVVSQTFVSATEFRAIVPAGATTGPITLTTNGGTATSGTFTIYAVPVISAISPTAGPIGTEVTITGTGFTSDASIAFNGTAVVSQTFVSATEFQAIVPAGATTGPITLTNPGGTATSGTFTVYPTPTITSFTPGSGYADDIITITGTDFTASAVVYFNGVEALSQFNSATEMLAMVPATATDGPITVTTEGGTATSATNFDRLYPAPTITSISPTAGAIGTEVTINGTNFTSDASIAFNGTAVVSKTFVDATQYKATVPAGATTGPITITTNGGTATSATFTVYPAPTISAINPVGGPIGAEVTITGTNFTSDASIAFNGTAVASKTFVSATEFRAIVPAGATTGPITLTTNGGTATSGTFTIYAVPTISAISPTFGGAGMEVTITGTGFTADASIAFNGTAVVSQTFVSATEFRAIVPAGATTGPITLTNPGGTATSGTFTVYPVPVITSFTPGSGYADDIITITGTDFTASAVVYFNGVEALSQYNSATEMLAMVPATATDGPITVTTEGGTATSATNFDRLYPAPTITSISPTEGAIGTEVTINGTNFTSDASIAFNGTAVVSKIFVDATQYKATVPAGATTGPITITTNGGTATSATFTVYPPPTITSFTPGSGYADDVILIFGTDFTASSVVYFNGVAATSVVYSATEIEATVPAAATDGPISVTTENGTANSATAFDVLLPPPPPPPAPTISSFTPVSGSIGIEVTIKGSNFDTNTTIAFNGVAVITKTLVNDSVMTAIVPTGATDGFITVSDGSVTDTSDTQFIITTTGSYTWNGSFSSNWSDADNWTPARTTPGAADELIFDGGMATVTIDVSETIGQLKVINGAAVTLSVDANQTLSLDGGATGTDFYIDGTSSLTLTNTAAAGLAIAITAGEVGVVEGDLTLQGGAADATHQLTAAGTNGLVFQSGGTFTTGTNFAGNPFGTTTAGSVLFMDGSVYNNQAGDSPFGMAAPDGVVSFASASTYNHMQNSAPDMAGRIYGNFVIDFDGINQTATGSGNLVVTNLTMASTGTFNLGVVGDISINGNIEVVDAAGILAFDPGAPSNYNMVGAAPQTVSGAGSFTLGANATFNVQAGRTVTLANTNSIAGTGQVSIEGTVITAHTGGLVGTGGAFASTTTSNLAAGSTVVYNAAGAQTITELAYGNLTIAGDRGSQTVTLPTGTNFKVAGVFTPSATNVTYSANSTIEFNGSSQIVPVFPYHNLTISGSGVNTLAAGNIDATGELYLNNSTLQTGTNIVELGTTGSLNEFGSGYLNGQVRVTREVTTGNTQNFGGVGVEMTPADGSPSPGTTTILRDTRTAVPARPDTGGKGSINRVYYITNGTAGINVTMTLRYDDRELQLNGLDESTGLKMYRQNAEGLWEEKLASTADAGANTVTLIGVTAFSPWTMAEPNTTLPVELTSFKARRRNDLVELSWTTATEHNNQGFEVEVSSDGQSFEKVGFVASKNPNSRVLTTYTFTDRKTLTSGTRYYRLKQIDLDGTVAYSRTEAVTVEKAMAATKVYPNPFNDVFGVYYVAETSHAVTLTVMDALGKKVSERVVQVTPGNHVLQMQVGNHHPKGLYLLRISGAGNMQTLRIIKEVINK